MSTDTTITARAVRRGGTTIENEAPAPDDATGDARLGAILRAAAVTGRGFVLGDAHVRGDRGVRRVSRGSAVDGPTTLEELFVRHRSTLVAYARRFVDPGHAEDVVQRSFEKVWRRRPVLRDLDNPTAYLVTAVRNEVHRDLRRSISERGRREPGDPAVTLESAPGAGDVAVTVSIQVAVREELDRLSPREREAVVLRIQWQLDVSETAEVMGVSAGSVKSYTHHGLRKLRAALAAA